MKTFEKIIRNKVITEYNKTFPNSLNVSNSNYLVDDIINFWVNNYEDILELDGIEKTEGYYTFYRVRIIPRENKIIVRGDYFDSWEEDEEFTIIS